MEPNASAQSSKSLINFCPEYLESIKRDKYRYAKIQHCYCDGAKPDVYRILMYRDGETQERLEAEQARSSGWAGAKRVDYSAPCICSIFPSSVEAGESIVKVLGLEKHPEGFEAREVFWGGKTIEQERAEREIEKATREHMFRW